MEALVHRPAMASIMRLFPFLKPYRLWIALKLITIILSAGNDIFVVYVINRLVNAAVASDSREANVSMLLMVASILLGIILSFAERYATGRFTVYALRDMRDSFSAHLDRLPLYELELHHSGDIQSR
jgi:ABC-type multidrug transport system fused ATPase/permease subunit